jgi:hypothetical protein
MGLEFISRHRKRFSPLQKAQKVIRSPTSFLLSDGKVVGENEALSHFHPAAELRTHEAYA